MSTITREQQKQILIDTANHVINRDDTSPYSENLRHLARIALASLEAEPVAVNDDMAYAFHHALTDGALGADEVEEIKTGLRAAFANVTAPPALVAVPDEVLARLEHEANHLTAWHHIDEHSCKVYRRDLLTLVNACRAAMLQEVK